jgi:hypothetical protein
MNEKDRTFHEIFYKRGGLFDPDDFGLDDMSKTTLVALKNNFQMYFHHLKLIYSDLPPIYFDFINCFSLNASARNYKGEFFIGINIGTYGIIAELFNKSLANGELLKNIGNANIESKIKSELSFKFNETDLTHESQLIPIIPIDPVRKAYADLYTGMAMEFLMLHELGHVIRGHCAYIENKYKTSWNEFQVIDSGGTTEDLLNRQTMEMDADRFAVNTAINILETHLKNPGLFSINPLLTDVYNNSETHFLHWIFAIYTFFRICGFEDFDSHKMESVYHPPATVRVLIIMTIISVMFREKNQSNTELVKAMKKIIEMIAIAEETYSFMTNDKNQGKTFALNGYYSREYMSKIRKNWNIVRELLIPFAINPELLSPPFTD